MLRAAVILLIATALAAPAQAQFLRRKANVGPPANLTPYEASVWPFPAPDPKSWWDDDRMKPSEAADPLGGRRLGRGETLATVDNGVDPSTYRLWGLMPLQWQAVRGDELVMEVWIRPARSVRQSVIRVTARRDGKAFVQVRAGLACCEAGIGRRMGFDAELPAGQARVFQALRSHAMWSAPRAVRVAEGGGVTEGLCLDGVSYDLTLLVPGSARTLRRACDNAEIGQIADALEPLLGAALGHDPRFDVLFPGGASFQGARGAYQDMIAQGGVLKPETTSRAQPPALSPPTEDVSPPSATSSSNPNP